MLPHLYHGKECRVDPDYARLLGAAGWRTTRRRWRRSSASERRTCSTPAVSWKVGSVSHLQRQKRLVSAASTVCTSLQLRSLSSTPSTACLELIDMLPGCRGGSGARRCCCNGRQVAGGAGPGA